MIQTERPQLSILAVNKQIHCEAGSIFYQNIFNFDCGWEGVPAFLSDRPYWALGCITRVCLHYCHDKEQTSRTIRAWRNLCKSLRKYLQLKEVILHLQGPFWPDSDSWDWNDLTEVEWIRQFVKITGLEHLSVDMYLNHDYKEVEQNGELRPADRLDILLQSKMMRPGGRFLGWRAIKALASNASDIADGAGSKTVQQPY